MRWYWAFLLLPHLTLSAAKVNHRVLTHGNGRLAIVGHDGVIEWEMLWGGIHDICQFANGNIMVQETVRQVVEIDHRTKEVVWRYDKLDGQWECGKEGRGARLSAAGKRQGDDR